MSLPANMSPGKVLLISLVFMVTITGCESDLDVGFIIDSSGSIVSGGKQNWDHVLNFVAAIINGLPRMSTRIGAVVFGDKAEVIVNFDWFDDDSYHARDAVYHAVHLGDSQKRNTSGGLYIARTLLFDMNHGDRKDAQSIAIVITVGRSDVDNEKTIPMAEALHRHGVKVFCIGITDSVDFLELKAISSEPQEEEYAYYTIPDFSMLPDLTCTLIHNMKDQQETSFPHDMDIGYILDGSGNNLQNWNMILDFIGILIDHFPRFDSRIGVVVFSNEARVTLKLDQYHDLCQAKRVILQTGFPVGRTNISGALYIANTQLFNVNNGDRPNVPNVAILIISSKSDIDTDKTIDMARTLHQSGVKVISIGVGDKVDEHELKDIISSPPQQRYTTYFNVSESKRLIEIIEGIMIHIGKRRHFIDTTTKMSIEHYPKSVTTTEIITTTTTTTTTVSRSVNDNNSKIVLHIVVPVIGGLLFVLLILVLACIIYRRRIKADQPSAPSAEANQYENQVISIVGNGKQTSRRGPIYDEASKAYIYEEAAPAHIYNDAISAQTHRRHPAETNCVYSYATSAHPAIYDIAEPSDGAYSQVTPAAAQQQQPQGNQSVYSQVQRKRSYIYAQVQKKKPYIYAQVNKAKKRNNDDK